MQEIPCAHCGNYVLERYAVKGVLIDNMSRESYCSEECRDSAESGAYKAVLGVASSPDWQEAGRDLGEGSGMADPFAD